MNTKNALISICLLWTVGILSGQVAQTDPEYRAAAVKTDRQIANEALEDLASGVLIVRLPSRATKIATLKERIGAGEGEVEQYRQMLEETEGDRTEFALQLMAAFQSSYEFSEVYFLWDTIEAIEKGDLESCIFLNEFLEPDPSIRMTPGQSYLLAFDGQTNPSEGLGITGLIICDRNMVRLKDPFPHYLPYDSGANGLRMMLFGTSRAKIIRKVVQNWNRDLFRYHRRISQ